MLFVTSILQSHNWQNYNKISETLARTYYTPLLRELVLAKTTSHKV
jgi:hypothetical protein